MESGGGSASWRANLPFESRRRVVGKIFEVLERSFLTDLTKGLIDLHRVAERLEWRMHSIAPNQSEYLRRVSLRILHLASESPLLLEPQPPHMALPSQGLNHRLEVDHNHTEEDLLDRDPPRSHEKLCERDRLSDLPDSMLHHIMSFLLAKDVPCTCVLSRRWRLLWTSAPCLDISTDQFGNDRVRFSKFVDHLLQLRAPASLDTFRLHSFAIDRACNWIDHAIKHNVRVLEFTEDARWEPLYLDPQCIAFTSEFLTCLKLTNVALDASVFDPLSRTCPSLGTLQLIGSFFEVSEISSNSLKRLDIIDCSFSKDLMICTPNLISLCFESLQCKCASFSDPSKITAAVTLCDLSSAKNIELSSSTIEVRFGKEHLRCLFNNLKNLSLGEWCLSDNFSPLVYFLQHSPQLEKLTLKLKMQSDEGVGIDAICLHERSFSSDLLKKATICCSESDARVSVLVTMLHANVRSLAEVDIRHY